MSACVSAIACSVSATPMVNARMNGRAVFMEAILCRRNFLSSLMRARRFVRSSLTGVGLVTLLSFERGFAKHSSMSKRLVLLTTTVCFVFALIAASAQETPMPAAPAGIQQNVQALDPAAATQAWLATVPTSKREKSDAYFEGGYWLILWNFLLAAAISIFLLASRSEERRVGKERAFRAV